MADEKGEADDTSSLPTGSKPNDRPDTDVSKWIKNLAALVTIANGTFLEATRSMPRFLFEYVDISQRRLYKRLERQSPHAACLPKVSSFW